jgi:hypothetical protein
MEDFFRRNPAKKGPVDADRDAGHAAIDVGEVVRHLDRCGRGVGWIRSGDDRQNGGSVLCRSRHRADMIKGFRKREDAMAAHSAPGRLDADEPATG